MDLNLKNTEWVSKMCQYRALLDLMFSAVEGLGSSLFEGMLPVPKGKKQGFDIFFH